MRVARRRSEHAKVGDVETGSDHATDQDGDQAFSAAAMTDGQHRGHEDIPPAGGPALAAAAVGPGDDLQQVTVRVFEVQSAAAVPVVDHPRPGLARIGPVRKVLVADPVKGRIEFFLTHEEGVVLGRDLPGGLGEVQGDIIVGLDHEKMGKPGWRRQAKDARQEGRRPLLVTARDDGVVQ